MTLTYIFSQLLLPDPVAKLWWRAGYKRQFNSWDILIFTFDDINTHFQDQPLGLNITIQSSVIYASARFSEDRVLDIQCHNCCLLQVTTCSSLTNSWNCSTRLEGRPKVEILLSSEHQKHEQNRLDGDTRKKTTRINVELYCKGHSHCGFLASIKCTPNSTCDEVPTGSKKWTCYVLKYQPARTIVGRTIISGYQGQADYPAIKEVSEKAVYIWNSERKDTVHCQLECDRRHHFVSG